MERKDDDDEKLLKMPELVIVVNHDYCDEFLLYPLFQLTSTVQKMERFRHHVEV